MPAFVAFLQHRLSVQIDLPRSNVSPKAELPLSPATQRRRRDFCARDPAIYAGIPVTP
ncbi:MAG: hypothetical protein WCS20_07685 [Alphaproteobacteria bacterium]